MTSQNYLVSNYKTGSLSFYDSKIEEENIFLKGLTLLVLTFAWPLFLFPGSLMAVHFTIKHALLEKERKNLQNLVQDEGQLLAYGENKLAAHTRRFDNLTAQAQRLVKTLQDRYGKDALPGIALITEQTTPQAFRDDFLTADFSNLHASEDLLAKLKRYQLRLSRLQNESPYRNHDGRDLNSIKAIVQAALVKKELRSLEAKKWIRITLLWLIPSGVFWSIPSNDRAIFPQDLLERHNELMTQHDYLLPYIDKNQIHDAATQRENT